MLNHQWTKNTLAKYGRKRWSQNRYHGPNFGRNCTEKCKLFFGPFKGKSFNSVPRWYLEELLTDNRINAFDREEIKNLLKN